MPVTTAVSTCPHGSLSEFNLQLVLLEPLLDGQDSSGPEGSRRENPEILLSLPFFFFFSVRREERTKPDGEWKRVMR